MASLCPTAWERLYGLVRQDVNGKIDASGDRPDTVSFRPVEIAEPDAMTKINDAAGRSELMSRVRARDTAPGAHRSAYRSWPRVPLPPASQALARLSRHRVPSLPGGRLC